MRTAPFALALFSTHLLFAQVETKLSYDVSTVKPHLQNDGMSSGAPKGEFRVMNADLKGVIADAWGVRPDQVAGEPAWVDNEHWDITAKVTGVSPAALKALSKDDVRAMNQALLADRFRVKVHVETRQGTVFNLVPSRNGIKLSILPALKEGEKDGNEMARGSLMMRSSSEGIELVAHAINAEVLLNNIALDLRKTIIDKTGIPPGAKFDVRLRFTQEDDPDRAAHSDAPPLRTALDEQLGLHLDPTRGPIVMIVVDHVEKPTDN